MPLRLEAPENPNYAAVVVAITHIIPLDNCDNVVATPLVGFQAIVGKDTQVGQLGIVFTAETQLSDEYVRRNNLYRHAEKNANPEAKGYIEDNRRVKALKFRGHRSDALFMPLSSLAWTGADLGALAPGDTFDKLGNFEICKKYVVRRTEGSGKTHAEKQQKKIFRRVDEKMLPEHIDTENFFRNRDHIRPGTQVVITQKLHGTSIRIGNTLVKRQLRRRDRLARFFGVKVATTEFDNVYGSRKVIKDVNNPLQNHYYKTDIWSEEGARLNGLVPENWIVYGELVGWTKDGAAIQANYTYQVPQNIAELYVYRVAIVNAQGRIADLSWDAVMEFCDSAGLRHVPELWRGPIEDFDAESWLDKKYSAFEPTAVPLAKESPCDEGVCVRVEGLVPYILKAKSPAFLRHESKMLDKDIVDLETDGSTAEEAA